MNDCELQEIYSMLKVSLCDTVRCGTMWKSLTCTRKLSIQV